MADKAEVERKPAKVDLKYLETSLLLSMYARAKIKEDKQTMRRITYEFGQRKKSIRRYSSQIKGLVNSMRPIPDPTL